jgi:hypothetical protein
LAAWTPPTQARITAVMSVMRMKPKTAAVHPRRGAHRIDAPEAPRQVVRGSWFMLDCVPMAMLETIARRG